MCRLRPALPRSPTPWSETNPTSRHRRPLWLALCLVAACHQTRVAPAPTAAPAAAQQALPFVGAESLLQEAEDLWRRRNEVEALRAFTDRLERALVQRPGEAQLASRLAHAYFLLGYAHLRPQPEAAPRKHAFERGMLAAEQALGEASAPFRTVMDGGGAIEDALAVVDAAGIDALTWYVGNLGGYAAAKGSTVALFYAERLRRGLDRLLVLDESYHFGTPLRFSAIFLARAPAFAGGSLKLAKVQFERALALAPAYLDNAVAYAESYARAKHDDALFASLLEGAAHADVAALGAEMTPELQMQQARAQALLGRGAAGAGAGSNKASQAANNAQTSQTPLPTPATALPAEAPPAQVAPTPTRPQVKP